MLNEFEPRVVIAVSDIEASRGFYRDILGLPEASEPSMGMVSYQSGNGRFSIYQSEFAGTNKATAAAWNVGKQLAAIVETLKARGVIFEHYEMPGSTLKGDLHDFGAFQVAWVKDPDGNLLNFIGTT